MIMIIDDSIQFKIQFKVIRNSEFYNIFEYSYIPTYQKGSIYERSY